MQSGLARSPSPSGGCGKPRCLGCLCIAWAALLLCGCEPAPVLGFPDAGQTTVMKVSSSEKAPDGGSESRRDKRESRDASGAPTTSHDSGGAEHDSGVKGSGNTGSDGTEGMSEEPSSGADGAEACPATNPQCSPAPGRPDQAPREDRPETPDQESPEPPDPGAPPDKPEDAEPHACDGNGAEIEGLLASDQSWTAAGSPYLVVGETRLAAEATLTIGPGAEIYFCLDATLEVLGEIRAVGTEQAPIMIHSARIRLDSEPRDQPSYDAQGAYVAGPRFEHVKLTDGYLWIANRTFESSGPYLRDVTLGALNADIFGYVAGLYVERCRIERFPDTEVSEGTSLSPEHGWIRNSHIQSAAIDGYSIGAPFRIRNNAFDFLVIDRWWPDNDIGLNTIRRLEWQRPSTTQTASIHDNSIFDPDGLEEYALRVVRESETMAPLDATGNYWGPVLTAEMQSGGEDANISGILDFHDDFHLVEVDYSGFLTAPPDDVGPDWE